MSSMKFAKGPLYAALLIGAVGVALLLFPRLGIALPFEGDLVGAGLGLLTIILLVVSVVMGSREGSDDDDALTEADLVPTVTFGPQGEMLQAQAAMSAEDKKAQKAAAKEAKKEAAERAKFEKQAKKDAAKAAKRAGKGEVVVDDTSAWLGEIKQEFTPIEDETTSFGSVSQPVFQPQQAAPQPVFQPEPVAQQPIQMTPIATAAAEMIAPATPVFAENYGVPQSAVDMSGASAATDAPMFDTGAEVPQWAGGAYEDPTFQVPFTAPAVSGSPENNPVPVIADTPVAEVTDAIPAAPTVEEEITISADPEVEAPVMENEVAGFVEAEIAATASTPSEEPVDVEAVVEEVVTEGAAQDEPTDILDVDDEGEPDSAPVVDEEDDDEDSSALPTFPDVDTSLDDEVDDESITEVEERLDRLASEVLVIIENARGEVRSIRRDSEASRRRHNQQVTDLATALNDSRDEMTRLAEELAEAGEHQKAALDAQSTLAQAQIEAQKAELERQQAVARLRQVRVAVLRQEPVDEALLSVVEKSLHDLLGQAPSGEDSEVLSH